MTKKVRINDTWSVWKTKFSERIAYIRPPTRFGGTVWAPLCEDKLWNWIPATAGQAVIVLGDLELNRVDQRFSYITAVCHSTGLYIVDKSNLVLPETQ